MKRHVPFIILAASAFAGACASNSPISNNKDGICVLEQSGGPTLGWSETSGVNVIQKGNRHFKDLDRDGELDVYEDWRKSPEKRAADLVSKLSIEEMGGLMLCSHMQNLPGTDVNHYGGKIFKLSSANAWDLTDEQKEFLDSHQVRSILMAAVESLETETKWVNNVQKYVEGRCHGIPVVILSDPRNGGNSDMEFEAGCGGDISVWPNSLAMGATFDPEIAEEFGSVASAEYRAMGISTALSPEIDIATEPRWWRFDGTYGEGYKLTTDMGRAYCDGFQTSPKGKRISGVWGYESVNAMAKHWYGYGAQEGGREGHFATGEYTVFPGGNLPMHRKAYTDGVFKLKKGSKCVSAVMTCYTILKDQDPSGENVAVSYSDEFIAKQLRGECGFDGVICTDWDVTFDCTDLGPWGKGKPWGVENLTVDERHYRILQVGVDQFGGCNDLRPVMAAYDMWVRDCGEKAARARFEQSAYRILLAMMRTGVFENPYVDYESARSIVGSPEFMEAGYRAQQKSVIMLKNAGSPLPLAATAKVYVPKRHFPAIPGVWGGMSEDKIDYVLRPELMNRYFKLVDCPDSADVALVFIDAPALNIGWDRNDIEAGGNGYVPVTLQYEDYTAVDAREVSLAGGNPLENFTNRSFKGKTVSTYNRDDMLLVQKTREQMGSKPVIVSIKADKPFVPAEIEPWADAIVLNFGVQRQVVLDIVSGAVEPCGLLPMQLPANMKTVELQLEDLPFDMECYRDSEGNAYDYAFGLNWSGVISDERTRKYGRLTY